MRNTILLLVWILSSALIYGQNIGVSGTFNPNTISQGQASILEVTFTNEALTTLAPGSASIVLTFPSTGEYSIPAVAPGGLGSAFFNWTLNNNVWTGTQTLPIDGNESLEILFAVDGLLESSNIATDIEVSLVGMTDIDPNNNLSTASLTVTSREDIINCNTILSCNSYMQISLDETCMETITPSMILSRAEYDDMFYTVQMFRKNGSLFPGTTVTSDQIGQPLKVSVSLNGCDLSCWGHIITEDKLGPTVMSCDTVSTISCSDSANPSIAVPIAVDACSSVTSGFADIEELLPCDSPFVKKIYRSWWFEDGYGNKSGCEQVIQVVRASIDSIVFPSDFVNEDFIECNANIPLTENGTPSPEFTGYPEGVDCPNINYNYQDLIFEICGSAKKVVRTWNVFDWCEGRDTVHNQIIKVRDTQPPVCRDQPNLLYRTLTNPWSCTADYRVPPPIVTEECSSYTYRVGYKLRSATGNPFLNPIYDNVERINNSDGSFYYIIRGLPQDTSWLVYTITDACSNSSQCFAEVLVTDGELPTAICEGSTVVTLNSEGLATLKAESIDDNSEDNCEIVKYEIKKMVDNCGRPEHLDYVPEIKLCCADQNGGDYIKVALRVTDAAGNSSECYANVLVDDKIPPRITCPADRTVFCGDDYGTGVTGMATGSDNCQLDINSEDSGLLNKCGLGVITRKFIATDPGGEEVSCTQRITIADEFPLSTSFITFPRDVTINGCSGADVDPAITGDKPTVRITDCKDIALSFKDTKYASPDGCLTIHRLWTVTDWCSFTNQQPIYFERTQKITLQDNEKPRFISGCNDRIIPSLDNDCEEYVEHRVSASDNCTSNINLRYSWRYDRGANNTTDEQGVGSFVAKVYPAGRHRMTFRVEDECGNSDECSYIFTIEDEKAPTPICIREVVWVLDEYGDAEVWANDFDIKSFDLCDPDDQLRFAFDELGREPAKTFSCDDVPNGISEEIPLRMYVFDSNDNFEYCDVTLILQDSPNKDACTDDPNARGFISGRITYSNDEGFSEVEVKMENIDNGSATMDMSDDEGSYSFDGTKYYSNLMIKPENDKDLLLGVSTLDLVILQRHILGISKMMDPLDLIAGDVNNDRKISASDLVALRKVILGVSDEFPNNYSWRFSPKEFEFQDSTYPWDFPESVEYYNLLTNEKEVDFTAIKVGDVNKSSLDKLFNEEMQQRQSPTNLSIVNNSYRKGELIEVPFEVEEDMMLSGYQMELTYDKKSMKFLGIESGIKGLTDQMIKEENGTIRISYAPQYIVEIESGMKLFTIMYEMLQDDDISSIDINPHFDAEMYNQDQNVIGLNLRKLDGSQSTKKVDVYISPNPFDETTYINLESLKSGVADVQIFNATGTQVVSKSQDINVGYNSISISADDLENQSGVYYYRIDFDFNTYTGKIILMK